MQRPWIRKSFVSYERRGCSGWDLLGVFELERITGTRYFGPHEVYGGFSNSNENYDSVV